MVFAFSLAVVSNFSASLSSCLAQEPLLIAAASDLIVADRSAELGSIGVRVAVSKQLEPDQSGEFTFDIVSSGAPLKVPDPESAEGVAALKIELDDIEDLFVGSVAAGRGVDAETVRAEFGRGGIMIAGKAVSAGMADAIGPFEHALARAQTLGRNAGAHRNTPNITETNMTKPNDEGGAMAAPTHTTPTAVDVDAIRKEAREAECARIVAIQDATIPGHEALALQCIKDGRSPGEFALAQSSAEKAKGAAHLEARRAATAALPAPQPQVPAAEIKPKPALSATPETDEDARKTYAASTALQKEFRTEASYVAWAKATREGRVKIFRSGKDEQKAA